MAKSIVAVVEGRPDKRPDPVQRPPLWAYESSVVQAELVINGNGNN